MLQKDEKIEITFYNDILSTTKIDADKIFERFYKSDEARTSSSTGLGLSIAKELLNRMDGEIFAIVDNNIFKIIVKLQVLN